MAGLIFVPVVLLSSSPPPFLVPPLLPPPSPPPSPTPSTPPSPPAPPPTPPPSPPLPPVPPLPAGEVLAVSPDDIQAEIVQAMSENRNASIYIPPGAHLHLNTTIGCWSNMHLKIRSSGEGATLDGAGIFPHVFTGGTSILFISGWCHLSLEALHFVNGRYSSGGAIYADHAGNIEMHDTHFTECSAPTPTDGGPTVYGGAMCVINSGAVTMTAVSFTRCSSYHTAGAAYFYNSGDISISGAAFEDCTSKETGGALQVIQSGSVEMTAVNFTRCVARNQMGGAMYVMGSKHIAITAGTFTGCRAGTQAVRAARLAQQHRCTQRPTLAAPPLSLRRLWSC